MLQFPAQGNQFATVGCHKKLCDKGLKVQLFFGVSRFVLSGLITFSSLGIFIARRPQPASFPENSFWGGVPEFGQGLLHFLFSGWGWNVSAL